MFHRLEKYGWSTASTVNLLLKNITWKMVDALINTLFYNIYEGMYSRNTIYIMCYTILMLYGIPSISVVVSLLSLWWLGLRSLVYCLWWPSLPCLLLVVAIHCLLHGYLPSLSHQLTIIQYYHTILQKCMQWLHSNRQKYSNGYNDCMIAMAP